MNPLTFYSIYSGNNLTRFCIWSKQEILRGIQKRVWRELEFEKSTAQCLNGREEKVVIFDFYLLEVKPTTKHWPNVVISHSRWLCWRLTSLHDHWWIRWSTHCCPLLSSLRVLSDHFPFHKFPFNAKFKSKKLTLQ